MPEHVKVMHGNYMRWATESRANAERARKLADADLALAPAHRKRAAKAEARAMEYEDKANALLNAAEAV